MLPTVAHWVRSPSWALELEGEPQGEQGHDETGEAHEVEGPAADPVEEGDRDEGEEHVHRAHHHRGGDRLGVAREARHLEDDRGVVDDRVDPRELLEEEDQEADESGVRSHCRISATAPP
jgi:hypothetical protein